MFISQKHLPRRTVLRGLGASLALPLLDGMVPAYAALRKTAANPVRRLGAFYVPNGMEMRAWTPAGSGAAAPACTPESETGTTGTWSWPAASRTGTSAPR